MTFDEEKLTCTRPDGLVEEVRWDDLRAVLVETNDLGPFASDVFWILVGTASGPLSRWAQAVKGRCWPVCKSFPASIISW